MSGRRVFYIFDHSDARTRLPLARAALDKDWQVTIATVGPWPEGTAKPDGVRHVEIPRPKGRFGPVALIRFMRSLRRAVLRDQPSLIHAVTLKYSFLTGLACTRLKIRRLYTIAGLGYLFRGEGVKPVILRLLISPFLESVLKNPYARLIIQNSDDRDLLIEKNYAFPARCYLIRGSGVDLSRFPERRIEAGRSDDLPLVMMPTRLVHDKGVAVFIAAAKILASAGVKACYQIAGGLTQHNPKAITQNEMEAMLAGSEVEWLGHVDDLPARLLKTDLVVYPSYYGEGVPRVLLEACAAGCPVVTTDHPGCREAVEKDKNGRLVPVKDPQVTADAIQDILSQPEKLAAMGAHSRKLAKEQFSEEKVIAETLALYDTGRVVSALA